VTRETITNYVIAVVVFLWAASVVAGMIDHSYQIPGTVQLAMAAVAAFLLSKRGMEKAEEQAKKQDAKDEKDAADRQERQPEPLPKGTTPAIPKEGQASKPGDPWSKE
jgi:flagellar biosynthesis component FlhA